MNLDALPAIFASNVGVALEGLAVFVGLYVVAGSLRAAIRDKDFSPQEIARFARSQFFSPEYGALLGLVASAALAPDGVSRDAILGLLTATATALTIRIGAKLFATLKVLAGFPAPVPT